MDVIYALTLFVVALTFAFVFFNYMKIRKMDEGTDEMVRMAAVIRSGAGTFMKTEFRTIAVVVFIVALVFSLFVEKTSGLTLIIGALMSSAACVVGMKSATYANVRTAERARATLSIGETVQVALTGGSISGLGVQAFGILGLLIVLFVWDIEHDAVGTGFLVNLRCNPSMMRITTYSLGCSLVAMFNRVAGGNYTKAADISSDILAKIRHDLREDDSRVPNVIADFIGDNVNDIAGNCSDLLESFVAALISGMLISETLYAGGVFSPGSFNGARLYPLALASGGLLSSLAGLFIVSVRKTGDSPSKALNAATYISAFLTLVIGFFSSRALFNCADLPSSFIFGWASPWASAMLGIISGVAIGIITEYYTSTDYKPTRKLAAMAEEGRPSSSPKVMR